MAKGISRGLKPDFLVLDIVWAKARTYLKSKSKGIATTNC